MKRLLMVLGTFLVALYLGSVPASAQRGSRPTNPGMSGTSHSSTSHDSSTATGGSTSASSPSTPLSHNAGALAKALTNSGITTIPGSTTPINSTNLTTACNGFKNLGRCIAAIHVAHNLGGNCTFAALKSSLASESLGKAIQACDPHADPKAEAGKGIKQANADINSGKS